mmetsp:Transcript_19344/g.26853  ORF Transcript_19344/g.26853 Transcript_19344/m.26853 type:complete len:349 (-) Transcript_19344:43-1089(-)
MYNSFDSSDFMLEELELGNTGGRPACSTKYMLCSVSVSLMVMGGLFCLVATMAGMETSEYETPLLWGCFLGIMGFSSAAMAMLVLYWRYKHVQLLEEEIMRLQSEPSTNTPKNKLLETDTCMERIANSAAQTLQIVSDIEADVLFNDCYNDVSLHISVAHIKKAAATQEASMMYQLAMDLKNYRPQDDPRIDKDQWNALVNRIPSGHVAAELSFERVAKDHELVRWSRAKEILSTFIRERLKEVGRLLHQLDKVTAGAPGYDDDDDDGNDDDDDTTVANNSKMGDGKRKIEYHLKKQTEALRSLKAHYENDLGSLKLANQKDHKQIEDLTQQLHELRKGIDDEAQEDV